MNSQIYKQLLLQIKFWGGRHHGESIKNYLKRGIGSRISTLGELFNLPSLTYNPWHFEHFERLARGAAPGTVDAITQCYPEIRSVADVGCGSGDFALEFKRRGLRVQACEHSPFGRKSAQKKGVDCFSFDLFRVPPSALTGKFDVAFCFEVAEHIPFSRGDFLVRYLASLADRIIFTAATPGQGGTGHINEQPRQYWIDLFFENGMKIDNETTIRLSALLRAMLKGRSPWLWNNCFVFDKSE